MFYKTLPLLLLFFMSFAPKNTTTTDPKLLAGITANNLAARIEIIYNSMNTNGLGTPEITCFKKAMEGFIALKQKGVVNKNILTIIDFSLSSAKKRLWVIDLESNAVLFNTLVSHGINSGLEFANSFSNAASSNKSSLGFYTTAETYFGKHGLSLKLDGQEQGINNKARERSVVIHGANYANETILKKQNFLGRSQGCPAIPEEIKNKVIPVIKGGSCLFIYHPSRGYDIAAKLVG